ncbi:hypothetical protein IGI04_032998 [Brassica rapa subsp. trilocularis]|uniref:Uncharacterized protein n=1 Tax=Brassica rapa subsp. trilocularis TaxID=1813537 RepID=A0ABQ7L4M3_BRACM|nr:hypothetical protein IGI04_032998 [Brassica rapa subsp. trilocularis]
MEVKNQINGREEEIKNKMKKKRSRGMHVIGVVLYMLRRRRRTKPFKNGFWRRVVESFQQLKNDKITMQSPSNITIMPPASPVKEKPPASNDDRLSEMVEGLDDVANPKTPADEIVPDIRPPGLEKEPLKPPKNPRTTSHKIESTPVGLPADPSLQQKRK